MGRRARDGEIEPTDIGDRLRTGETLRFGPRHYGLCSRCGKLIRLNKPIIGSMHFCRVDEEERQTMQM